MTEGAAESLNVDYAFQNSRLPEALNPSIERVLKIFRNASGQLTLTINNDDYPSLEAYYDPRGPKPPRTSCQSNQQSPEDLITTGSLPQRCNGLI